MAGEVYRLPPYLQQLAQIAAVRDSLAAVLASAPVAFTAAAAATGTGAARAAPTAAAAAHAASAGAGAASAAPTASAVAHASASGVARAAALATFGQPANATAAGSGSGRAGPTANAASHASASGAGSANASTVAAILVGARAAGSGAATGTGTETFPARARADTTASASARATTSAVAAATASGFGSGHAAPTAAIQSHAVGAGSCLARGSARGAVQGQATASGQGTGSGGPTLGGLATATGRGAGAGGGTAFAGMLAVAAGSGGGTGTGLGLGSYAARATAAGQGSGTGLGLIITFVHAGPTHVDVQASVTATGTQAQAGGTRIGVLASCPIPNARLVQSLLPGGQTWVGTRRLVTLTVAQAVPVGDSLLIVTLVRRQGTAAVPLAQITDAAGNLYSLQGEASVPYVPFATFQVRAWRATVSTQLNAGDWLQVAIPHAPDIALVLGEHWYGLQALSSAAQLGGAGANPTSGSFTPSAGDTLVGIFAAETHAGSQPSLLPAGLATLDQVQVTVSPTGVTRAFALAITSVQAAASGPTQLSGTLAAADPRWAALALAFSPPSRVA